MPASFHGKVVVISGGSRGIGRGIATAFARAGGLCVIASSSADNLAAAAKAIADVGPEPLTALALFLCSEEARQIQGTAIAIDGGATVGYY